MTEPVHLAAPATAVEDSRAYPPPQAAPERHEPDRPPRGGSGADAPRERDPYHEVTQPVIEVAPAPDTEASQNSVPFDDDQAAQSPDDSCVDTEASSTQTTHYSIDDLVNAMQDLDSSY